MQAELWQRLWRPPACIGQAFAKHCIPSHITTPKDLHLLGVQLMKFFKARNNVSADAEGVWTNVQIAMPGVFRSKKQVKNALNCLRQKGYVKTTKVAGAVNHHYALSLWALENIEKAESKMHVDIVEIEKKEAAERARRAAQQAGPPAQRGMWDRLSTFASQPSFDQLRQRHTSARSHRDDRDHDRGHRDRDHHHHDRDDWDRDHDHDSEARSAPFKRIESPFPPPARVQRWSFFDDDVDARGMRPHHRSSSSSRGATRGRSSAQRGGRGRRGR